MKIDKKQKPRGMKHKIREERKREERIDLAVSVAVLIVIVLVSTILIRSMLGSSLQNQETGSTLEPKAAIVDHLSLTAPNQTFIQTATNTLKQAGCKVDYYPGEKVTVEFYRNLPAHDYAIIILRVHSAAAALEGKEYLEAPVSLFTSENYSRTKYVWEQLTDQLVIASYTMPEPPYYFGITPKFVTSSMKGKFQNSIIVMMGCEGLNNTKMAEAFIAKGAKVYISWDQPVLASHTDLATSHLLQHFLIQKRTLKKSVQETFEEVGFDPVYKSLLIYYPLEAGDYTVQNFVGDIITNNSTEIEFKVSQRKKKLAV